MKYPKSDGENDSRPATFGGKGFIYRSASWEADIGTLWQNTRVFCDGDTLRRVSLAWPSTVYNNIQQPDKALLLEIPNVDNMRRQCTALIALYERLGIKVDVLQNAKAPPNWIFQRDLYNCSPEGVILSRPASAVRRGEEVLQLSHLSALQIPTIAMIRGVGLMEGADILWVSEHVALVGVGTRTNLDAVKQLQQLYPSIVFEQFILPKGIQHLLGLVNFIAPRVVGVWSEKLTSDHRSVLRRHNLQMIEIEDKQEIQQRRGFNWVCLGPNHLLLPNDAPTIVKQLQQSGVQVETVDISEYRKCGGGLGCLTGVLLRTPD